MNDKVDSRIELYTSIRLVDSLATLRDEIVAELRSAVAITLRHYHSIVAFKVAAGEESGEIEFGLRFDDTDPSGLEAIADAVLEEAFERLPRSLPELEGLIQAHDSTLVFA